MRIFTKKRVVFVIALFLFIVIVNINKKREVVSTPGDPVPPSSEYTSTLPQSKSGRFLGLGITQGIFDFEEAFTVADSTGMNFSELAVQWDEIETSKEQYDFTYIPTANKFFSSQGIAVGVSINTIDSLRARLPSDLSGKPLNDPEVIRRYKLLVEKAAHELRDSDILYVSTGNEIDLYLGDSSTKWSEYQEFYNSVLPTIRASFPGVAVSNKITFSGVVQNTESLRAFSDGVDVALVTYYPFSGGDFAMSEPSSVHADFKTITKYFSGKKVYIVELGYPSGEFNKSTEEKQAAFVREAFVAWDNNKDQIQLLNFLWLHDLAPDVLDQYVSYYGIGNNGFRSYLGTLGLRTYNGEDKAGFRALKEEAAKREW